MSHTYHGRCPVCDRQAVFHCADHWLRDGLFCDQCGSIPRERAFAYCLNTFCPDWRQKVVHECSPADRSISARMRRECPGYIGSQFFRDVPRGQMRDGCRSENLEALTFADESIDLHCHLDVMEHVNVPRACVEEMERTLRPGGMMIFTTPVYTDIPATERRAQYTAHGVKHYADPEYHGNPIADDGALVTFRYGRDLPDLLTVWAKRCTAMMVNVSDRGIGVAGDFREVIVVTKTR